MIEKGIYSAADGNSGELFYVEVLGMTEYRTTLNDREGGCPFFVLAQRVIWDDKGIRKDTTVVPAHWHPDYFADHFKKEL
jgi:hypothetical protein